MIYGTERISALISLRKSSRDLVINPSNHKQYPDGGILRGWVRSSGRPRDNQTSCERRERKGRSEF